MESVGGRYSHSVLPMELVGGSGEFGQHDSRSRLATAAFSPLARRGADCSGALFVKGHSYGEFVFDQAFRALGGRSWFALLPKALRDEPGEPGYGLQISCAPGRG